MGRCWGITKQLRRCENCAGDKWLCHKHATQPKYFIATAIVTIGLSYLAGLIPNPWDGSARITADPALQQVGSLKPRYGQKDETDAIYRGVGFDQNSQLVTVHMSDDAIVQPFGRYAPFSIRSSKDGILISAMVHSLDGRIIGKMYDNKWVLNPNNYFQKNSDESSLEVIDEFDIPAIQVEYVDTHRLKIGGVFHLEDKEISELYPDFPCTPQDANPRAVLSFRDIILITGEHGSTTVARNSTPDELRASAARVGLRPWFDYSEPN